MTDRMFYHVKYQTKDGHHPQQTKTLGRQGQQSIPGEWLEELSFNTRHKGTCVHVTIGRIDAKPPWLVYCLTVLLLWVLEVIKGLAIN